jgi:tRNA1(Val) A37 N6-methylase TrmN6
LFQPATGYRVAIDPVVLAAAVSPSQGQIILDAGCGTGAAALCLASRTLHGPIVGLELNPELAALARRNVAANGLESRIEITEGSLSDYAAGHAGRFDQVLTNPPFHPAARHTPSMHPTKAVAHGEGELDLPGWIRAAGTLLKPGGRLTLVHRADRIAELLSALEGRFGAATIFPLWSRAGGDATRIVLSAIKGRRTLPRIRSGLVLHNQDGSYTAEAQGILRDAGTMDPDRATG